MTLSVVIPHVPMSPEHDAMLKRCISSLRGHDELIVIANDRIGFAPAVNVGLRTATGDYIAICNNDIELVEGDLKDLCKPEVVCSPVLNGDKQIFWGCLFVVPRAVYEAVGDLDERFIKGYFEDDDYIIRVKRAGFDLACVESVQITSKGGQTMQHIGGMHEAFAANRQRFVEKWGALPEEMPEHPHFRK